MLRKLRKFIAPQRWQREIAVSIHVEENPAALAKELQRLDLKHVKRADSPKLNLIAVCSSAKSQTLPSLPDPIQFAMNRRVAQRLGASDPFNQLTIQSADVMEKDREALWPSTTVLKQWCSALPHMRVGSAILTSRYPLESAQEQIGRWLGYTIVHPDIAKYASSFENLTLQISEHHRPMVDSLRTMSLGNNLHDKLRKLQVYPEARVRARTPVLAECPVDGLKTEMIITLSRDCWLTLCQEFIGMKDSPNRWVQVVLPGHGFGWINRNDILDVATRPPASSGVRRLRLLVYQDSQLKPGDIALDVLSMLGDHLTYLELHTLRPLRSSPGLKLPRLHDLGLTISNDLKALAAPELRGVHVVHVECSSKHVFTTNRKIVASILTRSPHI